MRLRWCYLFKFNGRIWLFGTVYLFGVVYWPWENSLTFFCIQEFFKLFLELFYLDIWGSRLIRKQMLRSNGFLMELRRPKGSHRFLFHLERTQHRVFGGEKVRLVYRQNSFDVEWLFKLMSIIANQSVSRLFGTNRRSNWIETDCLVHRSEEWLALRLICIQLLRLTCLLFVLNGDSQSIWNNSELRPGLRLWSLANQLLVCIL